MMDFLMNVMGFLVFFGFAYFMYMKVPKFREKVEPMVEWVKGLF